MVASRAYPTTKITSPKSIRIAVDCGHFMLFSFAVDREVLYRESRMLEVGEHGHDHASWFWVPIRSTPRDGIEAG